MRAEIIISVAYLRMARVFLWGCGGVVKDIYVDVYMYVY